MTGIAPPNFILASFLSGYPGEGFSENVALLLQDDGIILTEADRQWVAQLIADKQQVEDLCSEYIDLFERGRHVNPLNETEYGRNRALAKGNDLADIAGFYRAFGFSLDDDRGYKETFDHLAVELEFYALLGIKENYLVEANDVAGIEIVRDARKKFLDSHLGRFIQSICERPGVQDSERYLRIYRWCAELVRQECQLLGVSPKQVSYLGDQTGSEEMNCGGTACETPN
ncbi:MAG: putative dimethyl sulfoxide reductase chaperone [Pseudomonadota bacterium]|nr:putative dimethyl sulfoxide reductase chaperone [Pseudomonadota bacterium]